MSELHLRVLCVFSYVCHTSAHVLFAQSFYSVVPDNGQLICERVAQREDWRKTPGRFFKGATSSSVEAKAVLY
jgi:hypothetical protein